MGMMQFIIFCADFFQHRVAEYTEIHKVVCHKFVGEILILFLGIRMI